MEEQFIDFDNSLGPWLGKTVKVIQYYLHKGFKEAGLDLTKEQMIVLKRLHSHDGLNQNELALLVLRDKSSLARLLSKMERKNYIIKVQCTDDKRCNNLFLTDVGREVFKKTRPIINEIINKIETDVSKEEKQIMISVLKKIQSNFGESFSTI
ncbi:MarR family winged helix-turn-helix transcriptional regulator [Seonamhaeicola maritimus]|uniref:MarR family transcriptional regulator n=1 Tax=Seonamhaeicola maritimus TaxID=2591822 RepID=A0A5C7GKC0_9FLAO|nr:MarR family transcriptional regulator [Seonamhaeicola maritimus]TXG38778.1 MarR family transcriptional regulator [Seonamhaeicola maritimus]